MRRHSLSRTHLYDNSGSTLVAYVYSPASVSFFSLSLMKQRIRRRRAWHDHNFSFFRIPKQTLRFGHGSWSHPTPCTSALEAQGRSFRRVINHIGSFSSHFLHTRSGESLCIGLHYFWRRPESEMPKGNSLLFSWELYFIFINWSCEAEYIYTNLFDLYYNDNTMRINDWFIELTARP